MSNSTSDLRRAQEYYNNKKKVKDVEIPDKKIEKNTQAKFTKAAFLIQDHIIQSTKKDLDKPFYLKKIHCMLKANLYNKIILKHAIQQLEKISKVL